MNRFLICALALTLGAIPASAQSLEDLNIQIHGYATQGFLYTTNNNAFTTNSSNGSPAWSDVVVNVGSQPIPKLRVAMQARYSLLGNYGNVISLDFASADYKANDKFGVRFGKVKMPLGLFNEIQDIDPSYMWSLLPQSVYPIASRNSQLAELGGVVYGALKLGPKLGKLEYRGWGGEVSVAGSDGLFVNSAETGTTLPNGLNGIANGTALHWATPLPGLMAGASFMRLNAMTDPLSVGFGAYKGTETINPINLPNYFAKYEKNRLMVAVEDARYTGSAHVVLPALGPYGISNTALDNRQWYAMATYRVTDKLTAGAYDSQFVAHKTAVSKTGARYSKDWVISGRYDFNQFLYAKAEEHFIDGAAQDYDTTLNAGGIKPTTKLTILKLGVSF